MVKRNLITPEGRAMWDAVEKAAASAPEWAKKHIEKACKERKKLREEAG